MKAYRGVDNKVRLFRPEMNMERMRRSAARSATEYIPRSICDGLKKQRVHAFRHISGAASSGVVCA
uniref:Branched-chain-amino-acid transaminase n=1 Tax=Parascaris equorum TaxID=6256 RepID=A0A914R3Z8_PAREQ